MYSDFLTSQEAYGTVIPVLLFQNWTDLDCLRDLRKMPLRVLLADENLAVQKLVELTLQNEGMEVTVTDNSLSALDIALKKTPDIILADFNLEGLDIFSFVSKIRQNPRLSDIPIILLINAAETFDPAQLRSVGVQAFFKKPIDSQELLEEIKKLTGDAVHEAYRSGGTSEQSDTGVSQHFLEMEQEAEKMEAALGWSASSVAGQSAEEQTVASPSLSAQNPPPLEDLARQSKTGPLEDGLIDQAIRKKIQESVEKVTWDVLPELLRTALSKEAITPILEKVAWEVVTPIAESEIKKEITRLQAEE